MNLPGDDEKKPKIPLIYILAGVGALIYILFVIPFINPTLPSEKVESSQPPVSETSKDDRLSQCSSQYRPNRNFLAPEQFVMDCVNAIEAARDPVTGALPNVMTCTEPILSDVPPMPASVTRATASVNVETSAFIVTVEAADGRTLLWDGAALVEN